MQYSAQSESSLAVTLAGTGGNKLIKPKAYLGIVPVLDSQLANIGSLSEPGV
jgi:hypothetical protein